MNTNERAPVGEELRKMADEMELVCLTLGRRRELAERLRELAARGQTGGGNGSFGEASEKA